MKILGFACLVVIAGATVAEAQTWPSAGPGHRVRIVTASGPVRTVTGTIIREDAESLKIMKREGREPVTVLRSSITRMQISVRRKSNVGAGARVGFIAGLLLGLASSEDEQGPCGRLQNCIGEPSPMASAIGLGAVGAGIGALLGATIHTDRWMTVDHRFRVAAAPSRKGGTLTFSFAF